MPPTPPEADGSDPTLAIVAEIDGVIRREGRVAEALVLEAYGWTSERYRAGKAHVRELIRAEAAKGEAEHVARYVAAFRRMHGARIFSLDSELTVRRTAGSAPAPESPTDAATPEVATALPTYLVPRIEAIAAAPSGRGDLDTTGEVNLEQVGAALPFAARAPTAAAPRAEWTAAQYASLCAEMAMPGGLSAERRAAYGLADDRLLGALHGHWRRRFEAEPAIHAEWARLVAHYRSWLASKR
jgi:hypothetical protein